MRVLVIGSGGREHAICYSFARSSRLDRLYCAPGNAGIGQVAECVAINPEDVGELADFAIREQIDLTFVGGEVPLALGVVDEFESRGLRIVGASKAAARLEASKSFAKDFMARHAIATANYHTAYSPAEAIETLQSGHFGSESGPVVVKADGLAAGKGVIVARDRAEAIAACTELAALVGSEAAEKIVLEEFLEGREVSLLMFVDGRDYALMPPVRDHKRIGEGDTGPNTGGMGTITDAGLLSPEQTQRIINDIIDPTLAGCIEEGFPFRGILFLGLMMTGESAIPTVRDDAEPQTYVATTPKLLEYNVRFGDPETQAILVRLESDFVEICEAMLDEKLAETQIKWSEGNSACVVLAAKGYPQKASTGDRIHGLESAAMVENVITFHAGTAKDEGESLPSDSSFVTAGGRVLGVTATGETLDGALRTAYSAVEKISWSGMQYRRDIGV